MIETEVCIVGAGPGGVATALKLSHLGIPSVLIDKATFPRDKVCGDAISSKTPVLFNRIDPSIMERFSKISGQIGVWGIKFSAPNRREIDLYLERNFDMENDTPPGFVSTRMEFDNFLIDEVKRRENVDLHLDTSIDDYEKTEDGFVVSSKDKSFQVNAKILVVANGAHSAFTRKYAGIGKEPKHYAGAVRAYYENVTGMHEHNLIELHFLKEYVPGYFWVFPLPNNQVNVGLGLRTDKISQRKLNLKKSMLDIIANHPDFKERFKDAKLISDIKGYGLPLGSKQRVISGDHYMLVGDAGHLIDPLTGEGIGNAIYSGIIAADQAAACLKDKNYSAAYMSAYDKRVQRVLGTEMKLSYRLQQMMDYPRLVNFLTNRIANNQNLIYKFSEMYNDFELRKQLVNPIFWLKSMFNK